MAFDRTNLRLKALKERHHNLDLSVIKQLNKTDIYHRSFSIVASRILQGKKHGKEICMMMGGHVIRSGVQRYIIDLIKRGYISCIAMNGSGVIHDYEFALIGATTESVARYVHEGQFGLWQETGQLNDIINEAYREDKTVGMGEAIGKAVFNGKFPYKEISLLSEAYRYKVPVTVHVSIGCDIIHEHPNCDGAATGALSHNDFLKFASIVQNLEGGVVMNFGSAVMAPEVFLKVLSMARNLAHQEGKAIKNFTTLVCDLQELPDDFSKEPRQDNHAYYFRPWKTMLVRTVADGGESFYVKGKHSETIPALWTAIKEEEKRLND